MGQTPRDQKTEPSLELPSLPGFGRRKKPKKSRTSADVPAPELRQPERPRNGSREEPAEPTQVLSTRRQPEPTEGTDTRHTEDVGAAGTGHTDARYQGAPAATSDGYAGPARVHADRAPAPSVDAEAPRRPAEKRSPEPAERKKARERRTTALLPGPLAPTLTGLVVGTAGAAGTYGAMAGCEALRGVSTCGGAPGFFILLAILALMVLLGGGILHLVRVGDPASTSFLAVGMVAVVSMLVLLDVIFSPLMFVVVPVLSAVAFLLAQWVTSRFEDDTGRRDWT